MAVRSLASMRVAMVRPDRVDERAIADQVFAGPLVRRDDLVGVHGPRPGSGRSDGEFWQADRWFIKSRTVRVFVEAAAAISALDGLFATKCALGALAPTHTIIAVTVSEPGRFQLWTLAPRLVTLREQLDATSAAGLWHDFARTLARFNLALGEALSSSLDAGLCLDPSPSNFAPQGGRIRYIDDDVARSHDALGIEDAFVARFGEYPGAPASVWDHYARRFAGELTARLAPPLRARLRLADRLRAAAQLRRASAPYIDRVLAALDAG